MCTAITYHTKDHYFGRNLDYELSFGETVTITPRNYQFPCGNLQTMEKHYAMIGMAYVKDNYPLYYDATNEAGLSMAGLLFSGNAVYGENMDKKYHISPYEFIPWILARCKDVKEARELLSSLCLINLPFSKDLPLSPLHWILADKEEVLVIESVKEGLGIYENTVGVLTNNPPFPYHMWNLSNYMQLSNEVPVNRFMRGVELETYSRGMGSIGLPGDLSSASRFVRAAFVRANARVGDTEEESVTQFFHILSSVEQQEGCVKMDTDLYEKTLYSSCCNMEKGLYYYTTYENRQISVIDMHKTNLETTTLTQYPLLKKQNFCRQ